MWCSQSRGWHFSMCAVQHSTAQYGISEWYMRVQGLGVSRFFLVLASLLSIFPFAGHLFLDLLWGLFFWTNLVKLCDQIT